MRSPTASIRSTEPTEVPPYFCTISAISSLVYGEKSRIKHVLTNHIKAKKPHEGFITTACSLNQLFSHPARQIRKCWFQGGDIDAPTLGHIGPTPTLTTNTTRKLSHEITGFNTVG